MKTAEELLIPRFEVIALYPDWDYQVGRILTPIKSESMFYECTEAPASKLVQNPEKYPHLFKKLNWWENREESEMPKKVISLISGEVSEIEKWDIKILFGFIDTRKREGCDLMAFNPEFGYIPVD